MEKGYLFISFIILSTATLFSSNHTTIEGAITLTTSDGIISGTLREPETNETKSLAIIISGADRTDRDGNQPQTKNNSLKMLAEELVAQNIAVLNFDKRGVAQSQRAGANEAKVTLDTYISDVKSWIELLKTEKEFGNIILIGHGEGSLIGMLASLENTNVSKLILIGGASKVASDITREQFANQPANVKNIIYDHLDKLERGEKINNVPEEWSVLFRSGKQPYLISLFKHKPTEEIAKVTIPTLIVQGSTDMHATVEDAKQLAEANPKANKVIIENMNYVLKECEKLGQQYQLQTYLKPDFPLNKELIPTLTNFIFSEERTEKAM